MARKRGLGFLLILLVSGCFQRILPIRALETPEGVAFELPEVADGLSRERKFELLDLTVTKRACSTDCTRWFIVRVPGPGSVYLTRARIAYGEAVLGTAVRTPASELDPGSYAVSATVQEYGSGGELIRSHSMDSEFDLSRDNTGKLRITTHNESAKTGGCT